MSNVSELLEFSKRVRDLDPKAVLIVGFGSGETVQFLDSLMSGGYIIGIGRKVPREWLKAIDDEMSNIFTFIDADSSAQSAIDSVDHVLNGTRYEKDGAAREIAGYGRPLDLLIIDGSHDSLGPMRDFLNYEPFVRPGGRIAWFDLNYPNVASQYLEAIRNTGWSHSEIISDTNHEIIKNGIGIMEKAV